MSAFIIIFLSIVFVIDLYVFRGIRNLFADKSWITYVYLVSSIFSYSLFLIFYFTGKEHFYHSYKIYLLGFAEAIIFSKVILLPFIFLSDIFHFGDWVIHQFNTQNKNSFSPARYKFFVQTGMIFGGAFFASMIYGMAKGAFRLTKNRVSVKIPQLPVELDGLKIVQISDIHLGSFANNDFVQKTIQAIQAEKPDIFVFTGDLVNDKAEEVAPFFELLKGIDAKYQKYSILGNHDYGQYVQWDSEKDQQDNLKQIKKYQQEIGWKLLLNEHDTIQINGKKLSVIGVEYWGRSARWGQYGDIDKAIENMEASDFQLLLTHDPSHWDLIISQNEKYKDISLSLSGHTHGFQFGVEIPGFKWSPSQYIYPRWAGLYQIQQQYLYVNRGLGFLGYPGRVGIPPELTILTLQKT